jgi:hypothetical protein
MKRYILKLELQEIVSWNAVSRLRNIVSASCSHPNWWRKNALGTIQVFVRVRPRARMKRRQEIAELA